MVHNVLTIGVYGAMMRGSVDDKLEIWDVTTLGVVLSVVIGKTGESMATVRARPWVLTNPRVAPNERRKSELGGRG